MSTILIGRPVTWMSPVSGKQFAGAIVGVETRGEAVPDLADVLDHGGAIPPFMWLVRARTTTGQVHVWDPHFVRWTVHQRERGMNTITVHIAEIGNAMMIKEKKAISADLALWRRMRAWAAQQPPTDKPSSSGMERALRKTWYDSAICSLIDPEVREPQDCLPRCPLARMMRARELTYRHCCAAGAPWLAVHRAGTWADWLVHADRMIEDIEVTEAMAERGEI